jgi:hypothetical protein
VKVHGVIIIIIMSMGTRPVQKAIKIARRGSRSDSGVAVAVTASVHVSKIAMSAQGGRDLVEKEHGTDGPSEPLLAARRR